MPSKSGEDFATFYLIILNIWSSICDFLQTSLAYYVRLKIGFYYCGAWLLSTFSVKLAHFSSRVTTKGRISSCLKRNIESLLGDLKMVICVAFIFFCSSFGWTGIEFTSPKDDFTYHTFICSLSEVFRIGAASW